MEAKKLEIKVSFSVFDMTLVTLGGLLCKYSAQMDIFWGS